MNSKFGFNNVNGPGATIAAVKGIFQQIESAHDAVIFCVVVSRSKGVQQCVMYPDSEIAAGSAVCALDALSAAMADGSHDAARAIHEIKSRPAKS